MSEVEVRSLLPGWCEPLAMLLLVSGLWAHDLFLVLVGVGFYLGSGVKLIQTVEREGKDV
jgi:hypothetical protein